jgi:hypothetical protein
MARGRVNRLTTCRLRANRRRAGRWARSLVGAGWDALEASWCSSETIFDNLAAGPAREAGPVNTSLSGLLKRQRKRERIIARASRACRCPEPRGTWTARKIYRNKTMLYHPSILLRSLAPSGPARLAGPTVQMTSPSRLRLSDPNRRVRQHLLSRNSLLPRLPIDEIPQTRVQIRGTYFPRSHGEVAKPSRISQVSNIALEPMCILKT